MELRIQRIPRPISGNVVLATSAASRPHARRPTVQAKCDGPRARRPTARSRACSAQAVTPPPRAGGPEGRRLSIAIALCFPSANIGFTRGAMRRLARRSKGHARVRAWAGGTPCAHLAVSSGCREPWNVIWHENANEFKRALRPKLQQ